MTFHNQIRDWLVSLQQASYLAPPRKIRDQGADVPAEDDEKHAAKVTEEEAEKKMKV